jgi:hypothetical protein
MKRFFEPLLATDPTRSTFIIAKSHCLGAGAWPLRIVDSAKVKYDFDFINNQSQDQYVQVHALFGAWSKAQILTK